MAHPNIHKFADMLYGAERTRVPIEPLTDMAPSLRADDAYAFQLANVDRYVKEGRIVSGGWLKAAGKSTAASNWQAAFTMVKLRQIRSREAVVKRS